MEIKGIIAAMATAMYEDGSINESEIRNQVNRHIRAGVDGIFCLGTNGEFYILSTEEKKRVMRICVDEARGRVPVYAGTGCVGTQDTIDLSLAAQEIGVDHAVFRSAESRGAVPSLCRYCRRGDPAYRDVQHPHAHRLCH